jgi:hypothetical protein
MRDRTRSARLVRMIGTCGAEHHAGAVGVREEAELIGEHVAGREIRHEENVGIAGHFRRDPLDPRRLLADRVVERQRTVKDASDDLSAIGHLAQGGGVERRGHLELIVGLPLRPDAPAPRLLPPTRGCGARRQSASTRDRSRSARRLPGSSRRGRRGSERSTRSRPPRSRFPAPSARTDAPRRSAPALGCGTAPAAARTFPFPSAHSWRASSTDTARFSHVSADAVLQSRPSTPSYEADVSRGPGVRASRIC